MQLNRPLILALAAATIVAAATDCSKFTGKKKCTKNKQCKYEKRACVAKSSHSLQGARRCTLHERLTAKKFDRKETNATYGQRGSHDLPHCVLARLQKCAGNSMSAAWSQALKAARGLVDAPIPGGVIKESGGLVASDLLRGDVIVAQIRSPWAWYASLWVYLSDHADERPDGWVPHSAKWRNALSKERVRGESARDRQRFGAFVRMMSTPELGVLSLHVWARYALAMSGQNWPTITPICTTVRGFFSNLNLCEEQNETARQVVSDLRGALAYQRRKRFCWIHVENVTAEATACFRTCAKLYTDHNIVHVLSSMDVLPPHNNPSSTHVPYEQLYDSALVRYIQQSDAAIFELFPEYSATPV